MRWTRSFFSFGLVLVLLAGLSCAPGGTSPLEAPVAQSLDLSSPPNESLIGGLGLDDLGNTAGGIVGDILKVTDLLTCTEQKYAVAEETIGPKGGQIRVGDHVLLIPRGALSQNVTIKAEQMRGRTNSVRFSPQGLKFSRPAALTLSYKNCLIVLLPKKIVYTDEGLNILQVLRSFDLFQRRTVSAPIDHFSRYAVAF
jgi:hypothetical protein